MFKFGFKTGIRALYDVSEKPTFVSEPWLVYPAKKVAGGNLVSVFIFDKSKFESQIHKISSSSTMSKNPKVIISECLELLKFEVNQLARLRHPQILTVYEVLEETKLKFIFVTEPVTNTLATVNISKHFDELSIQKGILEVAKGLQFLHTNCSIIHFNLQPSSVFINNQGDWKLSGFRFLQNLNEISPLERDSFYLMNTSSLVPFSNINLNFTAPELILDTLHKLDFANDTFSLGCLIYYLYNDGDYLINCFDSSSISDYKREFPKFANKFYNHRPSELGYVLKSVPESIYPLLIQVLARSPFDRITIDQFIESEFFEGSTIKAMWFVDEFSTKAQDEKIIFIKGLLQSEVLSAFPVRFKNQKLLPLMIDLIVNELNVLKSKKLEPETNEMLTNSLEVILKIGSELSGLSFQDKVYDKLLSIPNPKKKADSTFIKLINTSVKIRLALIENLDCLTSKLKDKQLVEVMKELAELCLTASTHDYDLQADQIKLQDTFLVNIRSIIDKFDFPYIKNSLFELLCKVFKTTTVLSTKITTIDTFKSMIDGKVVDKIIITDQLLPVLVNLKSRDKRIVGKSLGLFTTIAESEHIALDLDALVDVVLSQCLKLSFGCNDCNQQEFTSFMSTISSIQRKLTEKKIESLPKSTQNANFDSLISTQQIKPQTVKQAPKVVPMQPSLRTLNTSSTNTLQAKKLSLREQPKPKVNKSPLNFGATEQNKNGHLMDTLNRTWNQSQQKADDDEFEDFQQAQSPGQINWNTEVKRNQPQSSIQAPAKKNFPPGFNASILTPTSTGNNTASKPKNNYDALDLI